MTDLRQQKRPQTRPCLWVSRLLASLGCVCFDRSLQKTNPEESHYEHGSHYSDARGERDKAVFIDANHCLILQEVSN